ncbi:MAG: HDOD domain-containing protein [Magnetococcales bacterium]|nr:HDOD domain-containing protein [Magnetococcales bacterium]
MSRPGMSQTPLKHRLIRMADEMPAHPRNVHRLLQATSTLATPPKMVARIISQDPVMTLLVLKAANLIHFGHSGRIASIDAAMALVGYNTVKNVALKAVQQGILPSNGDQSPDPSALLTHFQATGWYARQIGLRLNPQCLDPSEFYVAGLLHDVGKWLLCFALPGDYAQVWRLSLQEKRPLKEVEQRELGIDHEEIGTLLGEKWLLPVALTECLGSHHGAKEWTGRNVLRDAVLVGNQIAVLAKAGQGGCPVQEPLPARLKKQLGGKPAELLATLEPLPEL